MKKINDMPNQGGFFSRVRRNVYPFFWFVAAADETLLFQCPVAEQDKQASIGITVLCTAFAAILSSYYAVHSLFASVPIALFIAVFWGIIILNLDRFMVGSIRKNKQRKWKELIVASPRILLAIFIAILISKPLEVKIFQNQIKEARTNFIDSLQVGKMSYESTELAGKRNERNEARSYYNQVNAESKELENDVDYRKYKSAFEICKEKRKPLIERINTKQRQKQQAIGRGDNETAYKAVMEIQRLNRQIDVLSCSSLEAKMNSREQAFFNEQKARISSALRRLNRLDSLIDTATVIIDIKNGETLATLDTATRDILGQIRVLNSLKKRDNGMMWAGLMITMLFLILEITPLVVKILSPRGEYDSLIAIAEQQALDNEEAADEESNQRKIARKKAAHYNSLQVGEIDEKIRNQIQEKILNAQAELAEKIIEAWKQREESELQSNSSDYLNNLITKTV